MPIFVKEPHESQFWTDFNKILHVSHLGPEETIESIKTKSDDYELRSRGGDLPLGQLNSTASGLYKVNEH